MDNNVTLMLENRDRAGRLTNNSCSEVFGLAVNSTEMIPGERWEPTIQCAGGRSAYNVVGEAS